MKLTSSKRVQLRKSIEFHIQSCLQFYLVNDFHIMYLKRAVSAKSRKSSITRQGVFLMTMMILQFHHFFNIFMSLQITFPSTFVILVVQYQLQRLMRKIKSHLIILKGFDQVLIQQKLRWVYQIDILTILPSLQYSMAEEICKPNEGIDQLTKQSDKIRQCLDKFPELQQKVGNLQLGSIQMKYQYFLRKFQKFTEEHQKYKLMYENIENMVQESNQMKQENRSIEFIKKIMEDTERRYNVLKENIDTLRQNKEDTKQQLQRLKEILQKIKRDYFQLQRKEIELNETMKEAEKAQRKTQIHKTMFKIRLEKKASTKVFGKIKSVPLQKLTINTSGFVDHKISEQLQLINRIKQQFLESIGISITQFYKLSQKGYAQQSYANELIKKRQFKIKDKCVLKGIQNYDPKDNAVQVFKIVQEFEKEKAHFMSLNGQEILDLIIRKNKVGEVLHLIEEQKREIIKAYKTCKSYK